MLEYMSQPERIAVPPARPNLNGRFDMDSISKGASIRAQSANVNAAKYGGISTLNAEDILAVVDDQGLNCHYCYKKLTFDNYQLDHKVATSKGGANDRSNLVVCCSLCNTRKGTSSYEYFITKHARDENGYLGKRCLNCEEYKRLSSDNWYSSDKAFDGFGSYCKPCNRSLSKALDRAKRLMRVT